MSEARDAARTDGRSDPIDARGGRPDQGGAVAGRVAIGVASLAPWPAMMMDAIAPIRPVRMVPANPKTLVNIELSTLVTLSTAV
jgi:hypothetical protein